MLRIVIILWYLEDWTPARHIYNEIWEVFNPSRKWVVKGKKVELFPHYCFNYTTQILTQMMRLKVYKPRLIDRCKGKLNGRTCYFYKLNHEGFKYFKDLNIQTGGGED